MAYSNACRVCLTRNNVEMLFEEKNQELLMMLRTFTGISVEPGDRLPRYICVECIKKLRAAFNLKAQYQSIYSKLTIRRLVHKTSNATKTFLKKSLLLNGQFKDKTAQQGNETKAASIGNPEINLVELVPVAKKLNHYRIVMMEDLFSETACNKTTVYQIFVETKPHVLTQPTKVQLKNVMDRINPLHTNCVPRTCPSSKYMSETNSDFALEEGCGKTDSRLSMNHKKVRKTYKTNSYVGFAVPRKPTSKAEKLPIESACLGQSYISKSDIHQLYLISNESATTTRRRSKRISKLERIDKRSQKQLPHLDNKEIPSVSKRGFTRQLRSRKKYQTVMSKQSQRKSRRNCKSTVCC